ncbi:MAG: enoyl-CoA hydratase-related protein [Boseongicola sp.]
MGRADRVEMKDNAGGQHGDVTVVTIANPPSGVLTPEVRKSIQDAIKEAENDTSCNAIVIAGEGGAFAMGTGLDVGEDDPAGAPDLGVLCDQIEACDKPIVAAISGPTLGNGLELALATHARVASPSARLGAPEITIGLVPGSGGTQRLPKVVGGLAALKMLLSGRSVNGTSATKLGLVDKLTESDVIETAVQYARELVESEATLARSSQRRDRLGAGSAFLEAVAEHRRLASVSPLDAPLRMIECIEAALLLPYDVGRGLEIAAFEDLVASEHSRSLRHIFAAERRLIATSRAQDRAPSRPLSAIGIIGARGIGSEIAVACLDAGFSVSVAEKSDAALEAGINRIIKHYDAQVAAGKLKEESVEATLDRLNAVVGFGTLAEADVIIDPGPFVPKSVIAELDAVMKAGAVLATGTESVDVATIAAATRRPGDVVGLRLYPGMQKNRLAEIIPSKTTAPRALSTARALARKLDRLVIETGPGPDGIGQRITEALHAAADLCVEDGARISQVDAALQDWGLPLGSFAWRDAEGLTRTRRQKQAADLGAQLVDAGRLGRANGRGFYRYTENGRKGMEDPDVLALIDADRATKGKEPGFVDDGVVRMRCVAAMAGAGAQLLAEGVAKTPSDIDMVAIHGLGFARRTGGVMFAADLIGLPLVHQHIEEMSQASSRLSPPSSAFQDLIKSGKSFAALDH